MSWRISISALRCADHYKQVCERLGILGQGSPTTKPIAPQFIPSAGQGLNEGLQILQAVKDTHGIPVITDVHSPEEAAAAARWPTSFSSRRFWPGRPIWSAPWRKQAQ